MISAGGTGGGVYPAFAAAKTLANADDLPPCELLFVGGVGAGGMEPELLARSGIPWAHAAYIQGGPVHGVSPLRLLISTARLGVGLLQALGLMLRRRPDSVLVTGGWASLPVALAAWLARVPVFAFVPDIEPGLTLKVAGRFARKIAATTAETAAFFPAGQVVATGYPLRETLHTATREDAIAHFGLDSSRRTLLITGGSSGARSINRAVVAILPDLLADEDLQIVHLTGRLDYDEVIAAREALPPGARARLFVYDYLHEDMGLALAAADLVVSRAGASTLGEYPLFGLPAILVPYPYAWRYQKVNADYLTTRGAALWLDDDAMAAKLLPAIRRLFDDPALLAEMVAQARALAQPDGAQRLARLLITGEG